MKALGFHRHPAASLAALFTVLPAVFVPVAAKADCRAAV